MKAQRLDDGHIRIPVLLTGDGDAVSHGTEDVGPEDHRYAEYDRWLKQEEAATDGG